MTTTVIRDKDGTRLANQSSILSQNNHKLELVGDYQTGVQYTVTLPQALQEASADIRRYDEGRGTGNTFFIPAPYISSLVPTSSSQGVGKNDPIRAQFSGFGALDLDSIQFEVKVDGVTQTYQKEELNFEGESCPFLLFSSYSFSRIPFCLQSILSSHSQGQGYNRKGSQPN